MKKYYVIYRTSSNTGYGAYQNKIFEYETVTSKNVEEFKKAFYDSVPIFPEDHKNQSFTPIISWQELAD